MDRLQAGCFVVTLTWAAFPVRAALGQLSVTAPAAGPALSPLLAMGSQLLAAVKHTHKGAALTAYCIAFPSV